VRRESKPEIMVPKQVSFGLGKGDGRGQGSIVRLSVAGVEVESEQAPPEGTEVFLLAELVEGEGEVALHGRVQWVRPGRFAVHFGLLGVRATSVILRAAGRSPT
jgi:hypothetical protein